MAATVAGGLVQAGGEVQAWFNGVDYLPCPWCHGTGTGGSWRQHPEYARQLADERLTKFALDVPGGVRAVATS